MSSKNKIESKIEDGFISVLKKTSFAKTKTTEIIKAAGVSHQTFYRYYVDKYDLAFKISHEKFCSFNVIYGNNGTMKELMISILHSIKNCPILFARLLENPEGLDILTNSLIATSITFTGGSATEPRTAGIVSILKAWSKVDFKTPIEEVYNKILLNTPIDEVLTKDEIEKVLLDYENRRMDFFIIKAKEDQQA